MNDMAADGGRLVLIPPAPEMKNLGLGQMQMTGVILYHLEREAAEPGQAAQQNRAGEAGRSL